MQNQQEHGLVMLFAKVQASIMFATLTGWPLQAVWRLPGGNGISKIKAVIGEETQLPPWFTIIYLHF